MIKQKRIATKTSAFELLGDTPVIRRTRPGKLGFRLPLTSVGLSVVPAETAASLHASSIEGIECSGWFQIAGSERALKSKTEIPMKFVDLKFLKFLMIGRMGKSVKIFVDKT